MPPELVAGAVAAYDGGSSTDGMEAGMAGDRGHSEEWRLLGLEGSAEGHFVVEGGRVTQDVGWA